MQWYRDRCGQTEVCKHRHTPAGELLHRDTFLDKVLSVRVDERQKWLLRALVCECHLVEEQTRRLRAAEKESPLTAPDTYYDDKLYFQRNTSM